MIIIIGLGNPGKKFENTRHNIGFMTINKFAEKNSFPEFELDKKINSLISKNEKAILVKPQTFMNESGKAIKKMILNEKCGGKIIKFRISNLIVVHDDIDLPIGRIKMVKERGSAGHKGVESIIQNIGNKGLIRLRIGVAPKKKTKAKKIVLKSFNPQEKKVINEAIEKAANALSFFIKEGLNKTMNEYNR